MPDQLQQALLSRDPRLNILRGAQTIQAAPPGDIDPSELMRGEIPVPDASVLDMVKGGSMMDRMYAEANPIFRKMQDTGMFSGDRMTHAVEDAPVPNKGIIDADFIKWLQEQKAKIPTLEELGRQLGGGKSKAMYAQANRWPKEGGVLHDVLTRAAQKAGSGMVNTPGESRLLTHYSDVTRGILPKPVATSSSAGPTLENAGKQLMKLLGKNELGDWYNDAAGSTHLVPNGTPVPIDNSALVLGK